MGSVFRPASGLVYALYVEGARCAFESLSFSMGARGEPSMVVRVPATYGIQEISDFSPEIKTQISDLEVSKASLVTKIQNLGGGSLQTIPKEVAKTSTDHVNAAGIALLKQSEGKYYAKKTADPPNSGHYSIGYGHQIKPGDPYDDSTTMTLAEAEALFAKDVVEYEDYVKHAIKVAYNPNQFAAMVDLVYNIGPAAFAKSQVVIGFNAGNIKVASEGFALFNKQLQGGKLVFAPGLARRREQERVLFLSKGISALAKEGLTLEQKKGLDVEADALRKKADYIDALISSIKKSAPKEITKKGRDWRTLQACTKVHLLFKDNNWGKTARFVACFEGEVMSPGFHRGNSSREFQFTVSHITDSISMLPMMVTEPAEFTQDTITNAANFDGTAKTGVFRGGVLEQYAPDILMQYSGLESKQLDIYNYCRYGLALFSEKISKSNVSNGYHSRAIVAHELPKRIYDPNLDLVTGLPTDSKATLQWSEMYTKIMTYTLMGLAQKQTGRITFMQIMQMVSEMFLHEVMIMPNPTRESSTILIKPNNVFGPIPLCNIIYPIHGAEYDYSELFKTKPTRLVQQSSPLMGIKDPLLAQFLTNIAPSVLADKFTKFYTLSEEEKKTFQLLTPEEEQRGIVTAYNDLPAFITAAIQAISDPASSTGAVGGDQTLTQGLEQKTETSTTLSKIDNLNATPKVAKAVNARLYLHKELLVLEGLSDSIRKISASVLKASKPPFKSAYKFCPNRITIVPSSVPADKNHCTYTILKGVVHRPIGRQYHIFEEPSSGGRGVLPYMLYIDSDKSKFVAQNSQKAFSLGGNKNKDKKSMPLDFDKSNSKELLAHLKEVSNFVTGGFCQSVIIFTDTTPASIAKLAKLVAIIGEMCNINTTTNVKYLSDYYGDYFSTNTKPDDDNIKGQLGSLLGPAKEAIKTGFETYLKEVNPDLAKTSTDKAGPPVPEGTLTAAIKDSKSKLDTPGAVKEAAVDGTVDKVLSDSQKILLENVHKNYTQPLCEYYFYLFRYANNRETVSIAHNPYITPGYPAMLLDNSDVGMHLHGYVENVSHSISAGGQLSTTVSLAYIRRGDDLGVQEDLRTTARPFIDTTGIAKFPSTVAESLSDRIPFFGGEYAEKNIDNTYDKTIGCNRLKEGDITEAELKENDYNIVNMLIRRKMQYCKITDIPNEALQTEYNTLYKANSSRIAFKWNGGDFPKNISVLKGPVLQQADVNKFENLVVVDELLFVEGTADFVRNHTDLCVFHGAQKG